MIENIPEELKSLNQWVCVYGDSKVPMTPLADRAASSSNYKTWGTYQEAVESVNKGIHDNIGFVFADNGLVGIDIDDGYDEEGFLSQTACDIISRCKSYTEMSRSGRGFHILLKGDLPFKGKNNRKGVEIYKTARYFIMTGNTLLFARIEDDQSAIDYVLDTYFQDETRTSRTGLFAKIYHPEWFIGKLLPVKPKYPKITQGSRNTCLASLAGSLHTSGFNKAYIYRELQRCNQEACIPAVDDEEIKSIVNSITRYTR